MAKQGLSVAVIGAGAVGCYYGGRLAEAGHDVRFLMRRDYDAVRSSGLRVTSPDGDFRLDKPTIAHSSREIGPVDWVVCALKATSIEEARELLRPCLADKTRIIVLMNGLGLEERFAQWFGDERVFGGLAFTCINRAEPGHVNHLRFGDLTIAHFLNDRASSKKAVDLWAESHVSVTAADSLLWARWEKLCWNIPFNGMTIAAGGVPTGRILAQPALRDATRALMEEVVTIGNADLEGAGDDARIDGAEVTARMFALTETMGDYRPSTLVDFLAGRPLEVEAIFAEPLRRAHSLRAPAPRLEMLTALLQSLDSNARTGRESESQ